MGPRREAEAECIFAWGEIPAGCPADGAVDLRAHGRWNVDQRDAAQVTGGHEAGDVADDASAHRNEKRSAIRARLDQCSAKRCDRPQVIRGLRSVYEMNRARILSAKAALCFLSNRAP